MKGQIPSTSVPVAFIAMDALDMLESFLGFPDFFGILFPSFFVLSSFFPSYHFPFLFELSSSPSLMPWFLVSLSQPFSHF